MGTRTVNQYLNNPFPQIGQEFNPEFLGIKWTTQSVFGGNPLTNISLWGSDGDTPIPYNGWRFRFPITSPDPGRVILEDPTWTGSPPSQGKTYNMIASGAERVMMGAVAELNPPAFSDTNLPSSKVPDGILGGSISRLAFKQGQELTSVFLPPLMHAIRAARRQSGWVEGNYIAIVLWVEGAHPLVGYPAEPMRDAWYQSWVVGNEPSSIANTQVRTRWFLCPRCGNEYDIGRAVRDGEVRGMFVCDTGCADEIGRRDTRRNLRREHEDRLWPRL